MPPNSVAEWIVGRNIPRRKKTTQARREVVRVELTTDDEHESDTVSVTYPRTASGSRPKKVRFNKEMKAALKLSETESSTSTSASKPEAAVETTRKTSDKPKDSPPLESSTNEPVAHAVCHCTKCKAQKKDDNGLPNDMGEGAGESDKPGQEKATPKQTESEKMVPDKNDPKQKVKGKGQQEKADHTDGKQRGRANKGKENDKKGCQKKESNGDEESSSKQDAKARDDKKSEDGKTTQSDEKKSENKPAASVTEKVQDEGSEKQSSKAKSKKEKKATQSDEKKSEDKPAASSTEREEDEGAEKQSSKAKSKKEKKDRAGKTESPPPPSLPTDTRRPNLLMPVRAEVLQMEHAIETPYDPRPNAFVDSEHGICRVYHGPAYGNPYGTLYPRRLYPGHQQQIGVPHPLPNPWLQGPLAIGEQENMNKASQEAAAASTGATTANPWEAYHRHALAAQALGLGLMVPGYPNVGMWPGALQQDLPASYSFSGAGGTGANQIPPAGQLPFKSWHPGWPYAWAGQDPGDSKKPEENKGTETEKQGNKDKEVKDKAEVSAPSPDKEQGWVTNIGPGAWPSPGTKEATEGCISHKKGDSWSLGDAQADLLSWMATGSSNNRSAGFPDTTGGKGWEDVEPASVKDDGSHHSGRGGSNQTQGLGGGKGNEHEYSSHDHGSWGSGSKGNGRADCGQLNNSGCGGNQGSGNGHGGWGFQRHCRHDDCGSRTCGHEKSDDWGRRGDHCNGWNGDGVINNWNKGNNGRNGGGNGRNSNSYDGGNGWSGKNNNGGGNGRNSNSYDGGNGWSGKNNNGGSGGNGHGRNAGGNGSQGHRVGSRHAAVRWASPEHGRSPDSNHARGRRPFGGGGVSGSNHHHGHNGGGNYCNSGGGSGDCCGSRGSHHRNSYNGGRGGGGSRPIWGDDSAAQPWLDNDANCRRGSHCSPSNNCGSNRGGDGDAWGSGRNRDGGCWESGSNNGCGDKWDSGSNRSGRSNRPGGDGCGSNNRSEENGRSGGDNVWGSGGSHRGDWNTNNGDQGCRGFRHNSPSHDSDRRASGGVWDYR